MTTLTLKDNGGVGANQDGTSSGATSRACSTFGVDGNITCNNNCISAIPRAGFDPVDSVEEGGSGAVARVFRVDSFNVKVSRLGKEIHEGCFNRLGLVDDGLGPDVETTD
jgi:hypothetical protein